jgi:hypothetical protein
VFSTMFSFLINLNAFLFTFAVEQLLILWRRFILQASLRSTFKDDRQLG